MPQTRACVFAKSSLRQYRPLLCDPISLAVGSVVISPGPWPLSALRLSAYSGRQHIVVCGIFLPTGACYFDRSSQPLSASPILASLSGITILLILAFCQPEHVILLRLLPFILGISLGQSLIVDCGTLPTRALLFCSVLCHYPVRHSRHLFPGKQQSIDCGILANRCIKSCLVFCN
jgi:hypothetical protein